jgi:trans-aconitate 2-methyltransferase
VSSDVYTFGDNPTAAHRLALLAEVYEPASRDLLSRRVPDAPEQAIDLGAGPGHTTRLLHTVTRAVRTIGIERSPDYLAAARAHPVPGIEFLQHDVTGWLPVDGDLIHARFLLTHLADPEAAVDVWAAALRPGGRLVLQEVARLVSRDPALGRYYELVAELQQRHGQALDIGARMGELAARSGLQVEYQAIRQLHPDVRAMAALHVLNLRTWPHGAVAGSQFDDDELDGLDAALVEVAHGRSGAESIEQDLAEVVLRLPA